MIIDGVTITTENFSFDNPPPAHDELKNYVEYVKARRPDATSIIVSRCDDDTVDLKYVAPQVSFERIRRITGYLTGDLTTWNNAKKFEERDRVKHL